jgi:hypothetical protein
MKKIILFVTIVVCCLRVNASVDFGATWVIPHSYGPSCLGNQYVEVGFFINWEVNNSTFTVERSTDPNFSWSIVVGSFSGCGTCGNGQYGINDYGQFAANQVWHYRAIATSNWLNYQYKSLGTYTTNIPTTVNWISQVTHSVTVGSSPATESSYTWGQESRDGQGVSISLMATEISKIYLEQGNNKINFTVQPSTPFVALDVNVDNGGYSNVYNGGAVTNFIWTNSTNAIYNLGAHNLKVRFTAINATQYIREYEVHVVPKSDGFYVDNYCNTMRVWKGTNTANPTPLILSEGFDAYNTKSEQYYRSAGSDLIDCLLSKGFDVFVVNYNLNAQSIKNNGAVFQSAIRYISTQYGGKLVVATGMSMGGVINRFACAKAENDGNPLPISKMATLDAPQQGAVISQNFQDWRKNTLDESSQNGYPDPFSEYASNNDAAKELLTYNAYDPGSGVHTSFLNYLNGLNGDGYPHLVEKIGIAFSSNSPNPNSGLWINVNITGAPNFGGAKNYNGYLSSPELVAGSFLPPINIDGFPATSPKVFLSTALSILRPISNPWVTVTQITDPTFIPHTSSLDIVNNVSKFDKVISPTASGYHHVVPSSLVEPIVTALIEKNVYVQNKTYTNVTRTIIAGERIFAGKNVTNTIAQGDVVIGSNATIAFKAGVEIKMEDGFSAIPGSNFTAIITQAQCNGSTEYQNRELAVPDNELLDVHMETYTYIQRDPSGGTTDLLSGSQVYPNPTNNSIYITKLQPGIEYGFEVTSLQGESLIQGKLINTNEIFLSNLSSGIYLIRLTNTNTGENHTFKVTKV